jgi:hypothetical protein
METMTDMICRASSREGARQSAWVVGLEKSIRLSMVRTKAAVLPVPDWLCPIMFIGLFHRV